jgi:hypothetical protein
VLAQFTLHNWINFWKDANLFWRVADPVTNIRFRLQAHTVLGSQSCYFLFNFMSVLQQREVDSNPQFRENFCSRFKVWVTPMLLQLTLKTVQLAFSKVGLHHFYQVTELREYQLSVTTPLHIFKVETFPPRCDIKWLSLQTKYITGYRTGGSAPLSPRIATRPDRPTQTIQHSSNVHILYTPVSSSFQDNFPPIFCMYLPLHPS